MKKLLAFLLCVPMLAGNAEYNRRKACHALAGIGVAWSCKKLGYPKTGIALAWCLGIGKELYDQKHGGRFRCGDIAWTGGPATLTFSIRWGGKKK